MRKTGFHKSDNCLKRSNNQLIPFKKLKGTFLFFSSGFVNTFKLKPQAKFEITYK